MKGFVFMYSELTKTTDDMKKGEKIYGDYIIRGLLLLVMMFTTLTAGAQTVTFNANGGSGTMEAQTFTAGEAQQLKACTFKKDGENFTGWNTQADGKGVAYTDEQNITLTSDITLYAQWKHLGKTYVLNGDRINAVATQEMVTENHENSSTADNLKSLDGNNYVHVETRSYDVSTTMDAESGTSNAGVYANAGEIYTISMGTLKGEPMAVSVSGQNPGQDPGQNAVKVALKGDAYNENAELKLENAAVGGLAVESDATLILEGNNIVEGSPNEPAISVSEGKTLTIKGSGTLTAIGGSGAAGIGGKPAEGSGNVVIESGTITAVGGDYAAGIGSGKNGSCGKITIGEGVAEVISIAGENAESIGSGENGTCGTVDIDNELKNETNNNTNTIKQNKEYDLWLGDTRVTALNCTNILDDGTAKYDPETQTLTLDHPKTDFAIRSENINLTIKGYYKMSAATGETAVQVTGGSLVLNGDFKLWGSATGISAGGNMSVKGRILAYGSTAAISHTGTLTLEPGFFGETRVEGNDNLLYSVGGTARGDGSAEHPFEIYNNIHWQKACEDVANGCTTAGKHFRIDGSFYATTMMGTADNPFAGTLDGGRQFFSIVASISESKEGAALFPFVSGATLRNLCVKGSIVGGNGSAGIVGKALSGTTTMENCIFAGTVVTLSGLVTKNWMVGAKAEGANVTFNNCLDVTIYQWPATEKRAFRLTGGDGISIAQTSTTGVVYGNAIWAPKGTTITFTASGGNGAYAPSCGGELGYNAGVYSLTMPEEDVAILQNDAVTYAITSPGDITGGNVHTNKTVASAGSPVCISVTCNDYYLLKSLKVYEDGDEDKEVPFDEYGVFRMPAKPVTVSAEFVKKYSFENDVLTLKYGTFNKLGTNDIGLDVDRGEVKKITADYGVRFTGECGQLFYNFYECKEIDLSKVETDALESTANMFGSCGKLEKLNLTGWNTAKVIKMNDMFYGCTSLREIDLSGFSFASVTDVTQMFELCGVYKLTMPAGVAITKEMELNKGNHDDNWVYSGWQKLGNKNVVSEESEVVYDSNNNPFTYAVLPAQTEVSTFVWREMPEEFVLELPDGQDNRALISLWDGMTVTVKLTDRVLYKDGKWNTLCLPFTLSNALNASYPVLSDATFMKLDVAGKYNEQGQEYFGGDGQNIADYTIQTGFDENTGTLRLFFKEPEEFESATPLLVKWDKPDGYVTYNGTNADACSDIVSPTFANVTITNSLNNAVSTDGAVSFCGTYDNRYFPVADRSLLFMGANNAINYPNAGRKVGPQRAYFQLGNGLTASELEQGGGNVREFLLNFGETSDEATGILNSQLSILNSSEAGAIYNLAGQRLQKMQKGVNIIDGKKILLK